MTLARAARNRPCTSFRSRCTPARPRRESGGVIDVEDRQDDDPLDVPQAALATCFRVSFEEAERRLAQLPRMFIEPDGSFVWVFGRASPVAARWRAVRSRRAIIVRRLKGTCPARAFDQLLDGLWAGRRRKS